MANNPPPDARTVKLPEGVQPKPKAGDRHDRFKEPVKWLLGDQIIADLKLLALHGLFGDKLDARDWMSPDIIRFVIPEQPPAEQSAPAETTPEKLTPETSRRQAFGNALRLIELPPVGDQHGPDPSKEFWFDYLSDTGDGQRATYSIAYASSAHLSLPDTKLWTKVTLAKAADSRATKANETFLPRGRFLFVGGDTSYNVAEYPTLVERFQSPFCWAYEELVRDGYYTDEEAATPRPLFGIPGNHDYYDALDGFNRQFRQPVTEKLGTPSKYPIPLEIPGLKRFQDASYFALELPFGWWLWGLDTEGDQLDFRQKEFFKALPNPSRLIVATPSPTTCFGRRARPDDGLTKVFGSLGLELPFIDDKAGSLPRNKCRLDLAGDIHHYARYWGPAAEGESEDAVRNLSLNPKAPSADNYASVMAGGGGAFFHPSDTDIGEIDEQVLYPRHAVSRRAIFEKLFSPLAIAQAGKVWGLGAIITFCIYFCVTVPQSGRDAFNNFPLWNALDVARPSKIEPIVRSAAEQRRLQQTVPYTPLYTAFYGASWSPNVALGQNEEVGAEGRRAAECSGAPHYFWGLCRVAPPLDYTVGTLLIILSLAVMLVGASRTGKTLGKGYEARVAARALLSNAEPGDVRKRVAGNTAWEVGLTATAALAFLGVGIYLVLPFRPFITPFGSSQLVFVTLLITASAVYTALKYEDWRFKLMSQKKVRIGAGAKYVLWLFAVGSISSGLWFFGGNNLAAYLAADLLLCLLLSSVVGGLLILAVSKGKELRGRGKSSPKLLISLSGFALIGLWHASLQLLVPLFLIVKGNVLTLIYAALVTVLFTVIGLCQANVRRRKKKLNNRRTLLLLWVAFGALMLFWPLASDAGSAARTAGVESLSWLYLPLGLLPEHFNGPSFFEHVRNRVIGIAFIGAVSSCVWFGWYLAVMLSYNAHNNEAGGAARLESFKQFVRVKLTPDTLTAYVIGFNDAKGEGKDLDLRLIDTFTLRVEDVEA